MFELTKSPAPNNAAATIVPATPGYAVFPFAPEKKSKASAQLLQELLRSHIVPIVAWRVAASGKAEPVLFIDPPADAQLFIFVPGGKIVSLASGQIWNDMDTFSMALITEWKRSTPPVQPAPPKPLAPGDIVSVYRPGF